MFEAGATIKEVMEQLGHTDPKTTTVIYTHVTQSTKEKTSQQFSKLMKGLLQ
jgi:integrase